MTLEPDDASCVDVLVTEGDFNMRDDDEQEIQQEQDDTEQEQSGEQREEQQEEHRDETLRDEGDQVAGDEQQEESQGDDEQLGDGTLREPEAIIEEDDGELQELGVDQPTVGTIVGDDGDADRVLAEHPSPAMEHGSHEAARHGLHTDASGEYDPTQARRNGS